MSACAAQVFLQSRSPVSTNLPFTPVDPFKHQFYPLFRQAKNPVRLHRDVDGEKDLVQLCYTRQNILCGPRCRRYSLRDFYLRYFLRVKKSIFTTALSLSSHLEFRLIVVITCNTTELKYTFITGELLKLGCLLQH